MCPFSSYCGSLWPLPWAVKENLHGDDCTLPFQPQSRWQLVFHFVSSNSFVDSQKKNQTSQGKWIFETTWKWQTVFFLCSGGGFCAGGGGWVWFSATLAQWENNSWNMKIKSCFLHCLRQGAEKSHQYHQGQSDVFVRPFCCNFLFPVAALTDRTAAGGRKIKGINLNSCCRVSPQNSGGSKNNRSTLPSGRKLIT